MFLFNYKKFCFNYPPLKTKICKTGKNTQQGNLLCGVGTFKLEIWKAVWDFKSDWIRDNNNLVGVKFKAQM